MAAAFSHFFLMLIGSIMIAGTVAGSLCDKCNQFSGASFVGPITRYSTHDVPFVSDSKNRIYFVYINDTEVNTPSYSGPNGVAYLVVCSDASCTNPTVTSIYSLFDTYLYTASIIMYPDDTFLVLIQDGSQLISPRFNTIRCRDTTCSQTLTSGWNTFSIPGLQFDLPLQEIPGFFSPKSNTPYFVATSNEGDSKSLYCPNLDCAYLNATSQFSSNYADATFAPVDAHQNGSLYVFYCLSQTLSLQVIQNPAEFDTLTSSFQSTVNCQTDLPNGGMAKSIFLNPVTKFPILVWAVSRDQPPVKNVINYIVCQDWLCNESTVKMWPMGSMQFLNAGISPTGFPIITYILQSGAGYYMRCFDMDCNTTNTAPLTNDTIASNFLQQTDKFQGIYTPSSVGILGTGKSNSSFQEIVWNMPHCGPFVGGLSSTSGAYNRRISTDVMGPVLCPDQTKYCKFGENGTVQQTTYVDQNHVTCSLENHIAQGYGGNYSVYIGNDENFDIYGVTTDKYYFYDSTPCQHPGCSGHGTCNIQGVCECFQGWFEEDCSRSASKLGYITLTLTLTFLTIPVIIVTVIFWKFSPTPIQAYPAPVTVRRTLVNFLTIISIPLEFIQLSALSASVKSKWGKTLHLATAYSVFNVPGDSNFETRDLVYKVIFGVVLGITFIWCLYMFPLLLRIRGKVLHDYLSRSRTVKLLYTPSYLILAPMATFLFFPVVNTLMKIVSCVYWGPGVTQPYLSMLSSPPDEIYPCWKGDHILWSTLTFVVLLIYFPMAIYSYPPLQQMDPKLDIKFRNIFIFLSNILKLYIAAVAALFVYPKDIALDYSRELPRIATVTGVALILLFLNIELKPCNVSLINTLRTAGLAMAAVTGAMSMWAAIQPDFILPLIIMVVGWVACIVFYALRFFGVIKTRERKTMLLKALHQDKYIYEETEKDPLLKKKEDPVVGVQIEGDLEEEPELPRQQSVLGDQEEETNEANE